MRLGVNVVIVEDGRVLLAKRDRPPIWNLPGGGVEPGESPWAAAVRETREEVGVAVQIDRLTGVYDRSPGGDPVLVFAAHILGGELRTSTESVQVGWFDIAALPEPINPYQLRRIADATSGRASAYLMEQPGPPVREIYPDP